LPILDLREEREREGERYRLYVFDRIRRIKRALKKRVRNIEFHLEEAQEFERLRQVGELLRGSGADSKGRDTVAVMDYYVDPPQEITVDVKPSLDIIRNAEKYFKRARKLEHGIPYQEQRLQAARELQEEVNQIEAAIRDDELTLKKAVSRFRQVGFGRFFTEFNRPVENQDQQERLRKFISSDGLTIIVGRNAEENDYVTFRVGKGKDPWLHVSGSQGSHVIVRVPKGAQCPRRTLKEAAALAVYYSKARGNFRQEVTLGQVCNIRRAARRQAGKVTVSNPKYIKSDKKALDDVMTEKNEE
jgi:predicted ribosome quality control (RQC) complex YloA/Tae2 family protein